MKNDATLTSMPRMQHEGDIQRCYRYMSDYWEDALLDSRLKLSAANEFNDAFDCTGACVGELSDTAIRNHLTKESSIIPPELRMFLSNRSFLPKLRCEYSEKIARYIIGKAWFLDQQILCFSYPETKEADALMWSHYGNKWRGVRLGFDLLYENHKAITYDTTSPYALFPVDYSPKRPIFDLTKVEDIENDPLYSRYFYDMFRTKSVAWRYEGEWRLFCDAKYSTLIGGMRFWNFHRALLRTIDLGPDIGLDVQTRVLQLVEQRYPHVEVRKVIMSDLNYDFAYRTIRSSMVDLNAKTTFQIK